MDMKLRICLLLLLSSCTLSCASAQMYSLTATVQQPAGSVVLPSSEPGSSHATHPDRDQPLYSSGDVLLYLPAPANLAMISTAGKQVDAVILGPRLTKGLSYDLLPIGLMEFSSGNQIQKNILAIPTDPSLQTIKSPSLEQLQLNYPGVVDILSIWFENAYSDRRLDYIGTKNEREAIQFLKSME